MAAWFSILPDELSLVEVWLVRLFLFLAVATIGPWIALLVYDLFLFIWRAVTYDVPYLGGRARGRARPRAPSLSERPDGRPRIFSYSSPVRSGHGSESSAFSPEHSKKDPGSRRRHVGETAVT